MNLSIFSFEKGKNHQNREFWSHVIIIFSFTYFSGPKMKFEMIEVLLFQLTKCNLRFLTTRNPWLWINWFFSSLIGWLKPENNFMWVRPVEHLKLVEHNSNRSEIHFLKMDQRNSLLRSILNDPQQGWYPSEIFETKFQP